MCSFLENNINMPYKAIYTIIKATHVIDNVIWHWCLAQSHLIFFASLFYFQIFRESFLGLDYCFASAIHPLLQLLQQKPQICVEAAYITTGSNSHLVRLHWDFFLHWRRYRFMLWVRQHANHPWWHYHKGGMQGGWIHLGWIWHIWTLLHLDLLFSCDCGGNGAHGTHNWC